MNKINKKPAFSLMEIMVILLIMAVTLAATAPMISRKMSRNVGTAEEPWKFNGVNESISFNGEGRDNSTVFIGTDRRGSSSYPNTPILDNISMYIRALGHQINNQNIRDNRQAITFTLTDNDNRIYGHVGFAKIDRIWPLQDECYPFLSSSIPRIEGIILGNRMNMTHNPNHTTSTNDDISFSDGIINKVILGFDNTFAVHSGYFNNANNNTAVDNQNLTIIGSDFTIGGFNDAIIIGRGIAGTPSGYYRPWEDCVVLNTDYPRQLVSRLQRDAQGNFSFVQVDNNGNDLRFLATLWSPVWYDPNDTQNTIIRNHTIIGGANMSVGTNNTLLGHGSRCGAISHAQNQAQNAGDFAEVQISGAVTVGSSSSSMGTNSIAIGLSNGSGTQEMVQGAINGNVYQNQQDPQNDTIVIGSFSMADFDSSIAIGSQAIVAGAQNSVAIGTPLQCFGDSSIVLGSNSDVQGVGSVVIGDVPDTVSADNAIAIGTNSVVDINNNSIAIGHQASAEANSSVAIGAGAQSNVQNQIVLGTNNNNIVRIPGTLRVSTIQDLSGNPIYPPVSDIRLKNVGERLTSGLEDIKKLEFFNYTFKDDKEQKPHVGVMAQDLQKVFPTSVTEGSDGYLRIRLDEMFYAALNAIKELDKKVIALAAELKSFFERVDSIDLRVAQHQKALDDLKSDSADIDARLKALEE